MLKKLYTYLTSHDYLRNLGYRAVTKKSEATAPVEANANTAGAVGATSPVSDSAAVAAPKAVANGIER